MLLTLPQFFERRSEQAFRCALCHDELMAARLAELQSR